GPLLRERPRPKLRTDLKPQVAAEVLRERAAQLSTPTDWLRAWRLSAGAMALLEGYFPDDCADRDKAIARLKEFPLPLGGPRLIAEAISTAGGVLWQELDPQLMLPKKSGGFFAWGDI